MSKNGVGGTRTERAVWVGLFFLVSFSHSGHGLDWRCEDALGKVKTIAGKKFKDEENTLKKGLILWVDNRYKPARETVFQYKTKDGKTTVWKLVPNKPNKPTRYDRGEVHWEGDAFAFVPRNVIYTKNGDYDALFNREVEKPAPPVARKPRGIETVDDFDSSPLSNRFGLTESGGTYYLRDMGFGEVRGRPYGSVQAAVNEAERRLRATILGTEAVYPD